MRLEASDKRALEPGAERGPPKGPGVTQEIKAGRDVQTARWTASSESERQGEGSHAVQLRDNGEDLT